MLQDVQQEPPPPRLRFPNNLNPLPTIFDAGEAELHRRFLPLRGLRIECSQPSTVNAHPKKRMHECIPLNENVL